VIEAIPEVVQIKTDFYKELGKVAPKKTIFATNSSALLPSQFAEATGRPDKFLALHFANSVWKNTTAEVMKHPGTDEIVFRDVIEFAKAIGMVALPLQKEQPGYILNSLLIPLLEAAQMLLLKEVADVETIDKTWMIATGAPEGPFAILANNYTTVMVSPRSQMARLRPPLEQSNQGSIMHKSKRSVSVSGLQASEKWSCANDERDRLRPRASNFVATAVCL
jgi:3-hydroxyacyl-CoA dehydrogenase